MRTFGTGDALRLSFVDEAGFVPNRVQVYYCLSRIDRGVAARELWLLDPTTGRRHMVAGEFDDPRGARPSPDGTRVAFVADVGGTGQLCVAVLDSGEVEVCTDFPGGVSGAPRWSPDGGSIAVAARPTPRRDPSLPYRITRTTFRFEEVGLIDDAVQDIYVVDLDAQAVRQVTDDSSVNEDPRWSPDGRRILFRSSFSPEAEPWTAKPAAHVVDVETGERHVVVGEWGAVFEAEWCPGGTRVVFHGSPARPGILDSLAQRRDLWTVPAGGGRPVCRTGDLTAGVGVKLEFDHPTWNSFQRANLRIDATMDCAYVSAQRGGDVGICRVRLSGDEHTEFVVAEEGRTCFLADAETATGRLLSVASTLLDPPELFLRGEGTERRLSHLNDAVVGDVVRPQVRTLDVTVADGSRIESWALTPPGAGPFPTVLAIHCGPASAFGHVFNNDHHLLVGAGIAVIFANFRGSAGYGTAFMQELRGRWGEVGEEDHHAVIDHAIDAGIADPERLGVYGLSHGGFATCWLLGRTDRFRAGVAENPLVSFASAYGTMDLPWMVERVIGGHPGTDPAAYADRSPLTYAAHCSTPLLFVVGEDDLRCLPIEAEQYYRVLKANGCVTEMLRLPKSHHTGSWTGPVSARAAQNEALVEWFSRYLVEDAKAGERPAH